MSYLFYLFQVDNQKTLNEFIYNDDLFFFILHEMLAFEENGCKSLSSP